MKRIIKAGLLFLIAAIIAGAVVKMQQTLSTKNEQAAKLQQRPDLLAVHFVSPSPAPMIDGKPTLIILFNSDCEHCQYEAGQLQKRHSEFKTANVYMLTTETPVRAQAFARQYGLDTLSMMHVGTLTQEEAHKAFGPTSVPHLFIYGPDGQLRKEYKGETKIDAVLKYL
jgi:peroxiredoxin